jgi:hypothetical protein
MSRISRNESQMESNYAVVFSGVGLHRAEKTEKKMDFQKLFINIIYIYPSIFLPHHNIIT